MTDGHAWLWWIIGAVIGGGARWLLSKAYARLKPSAPRDALALEPLAAFVLCAAAMRLSLDHGAARPWLSALISGGFFIGFLAVNPDLRRDPKEAVVRTLLAIGGAVAGLAAGAYLGR